jgi:hypothetical protein
MIVSLKVNLGGIDGRLGEDCKAITGRNFAKMRALNKTFAGRRITP